MSCRVTTRLLLVGALSVVRHAHAEEPKAAPTASTDDRALELFNQSEVAYREAHFQESLRLLREAYALSPDPVLLYNMARIHETTGDLDSAISGYQRYLAEAPSIPDRPALEARIANLKALREEKKRKSPPPRKRSVVPWVVAGAGGVVLAGAGVMGILAKNRESDALEDPIQENAVAAREDATTYATITNVGLIAGGAIALGGIVWGLVTVMSKPSTEARRTGPVLEALPSGFVGHF